MYLLKVIVMAAVLAQPLEFQHDNMFATEAECLAAAKRDVPLLMDEITTAPEYFGITDITVEVQCHATHP